MDEQKLRDLVYRHKIASERYSKTVARDIVRLLNSADADLTAEIASRYAVIVANGGFDRGPATTKRMNDMLQGIRAINQQVYQQIGQKVTQDLQDSAENEIDFTQNAARKAAADYERTVPSSSFLRTLVTTTPISVSRDGAAILSSWIDGMATGRMRRLDNAIRLAAVQGETTDQLVKRIAGTRALNYADGLLDVSRKSVQTFAITANSAVQNTARLDVFKRMSSVGVLEWSSILDARTSAICQSLSGQIFSITGSHPTPPAHPRCRSILLPRRNDTDAPLHKPFGDWISAQPAKVQREVLGKGRAELLDKKDLKFDEMFRSDGSYKTLDELKTSDKAMLDD